MKKSLILALMIALTAGCTFANTNTADKIKATPAQTTVKTLTTDNAITPQKPPHRGKAEFEKRLNLTEEQKAQAKLLHEKSFKEMKPIMDEIKSLKEQKDAVKRSRIAIIEQEKRIAEIDLQIKALRKQAHELKKANFKEFEAILTEKQKKELKKMKKEGRKNFEKKKKEFDKMKKSCNDEVKCDCPMKKYPLQPIPAVAK